MSPILGFDKAVALTGLILVFYTSGFMTAVINNTTRDRNSIVDQVAIVTAINTILVVVIGIGWWKNKWLRKAIKLKSFDDAFSRVTTYVGIASTLLVLLKYFEHDFLANTVYAIIMYPIMAASNFGYAEEIRRYASA